MEGTEEELYQRMRLAYERDDDFLINNWRILPSDLRLEIMLKAFRDGKKQYISMEHFELYSDDLKIIQEAKTKYIQELGLSEDVVRELFWWHKPKGNMNMQAENINRNLAITVKLKEYFGLVEKYPVLTPEMIQNNPNILKCDSRRTESRICFLTDLNQGDLPTGENLAITLSFNSIVFCLKYQKELIDSFSLIGRDSDLYKTIMALDEIVPDENNEKFWEKYLRLIYGDPTVEKEIAKASRKNIVQTPEDIGITSDGDMLQTKVVGDENSEQVIGEIVDNAFPSEGYRWREDGTSTGSSGKPNKREKLDEDKIADTLNELKKFGIKCDGYVSARSGTYAVGEDRVRFYVLRKENLPGYAVLEPFGQVGNCFVVLDNMDSIETLKEEVVDNTINGLVKKRMGIKFAHDRSENQEYEYSGIVQRIINTFVLIDEFSQEKYSSLSFSAIKKQITNIISKNEIPQISKYLIELWKKIFPIKIRGNNSKDAKNAEARETNGLNGWRVKRLVNFVTKGDQNKEPIRDQNEETIRNQCSGAEEVDI